MTKPIESLITEGWTTDRVACEEAAATLAESDPDWTYELIYFWSNRRGSDEKWYCIRITDEDGFHVRDVYPRRMSRSDATKRREEKNRSEETRS